MPIAYSPVMPSSPLRRPPVCASDLAALATPAPRQALAEPSLDTLDSSPERRHKRSCVRPPASRVILLPRKLETEQPLSAILSRMQMTQKWHDTLVGNELETQAPDLWRMLVPKHKAMAATLFRPDEVKDNVATLKLWHVRLLLAQQLSNAHLAHFVYWLLMSLNGFSQLVVYTPRAERRLRDHFDAYGLDFAHRYLDQSRYRVDFVSCDQDYRLTEQGNIVAKARLDAYPIGA